MNKTKNPVRRAVAAAAAAGVGALMLSAGVAQAALQDRDLDGNGQVDAFYDTDLDITWLRDANVNGPMDWAAAVTWADSLSFAGYSDWRLPTSDTCEGYNCTGSEMGHLWYVELGNTAGGPMTNTGDFQNLQSYHYWSGTEAALPPNSAWTFYTSAGTQFVDAKYLAHYALAVRPGDVVAIPEPQTTTLLLLGLTVLAAAVRRRAS